MKHILRGLSAMRFSSNRTPLYNERRLESYLQLTERLKETHLGKPKFGAAMSPYDFVEFIDLAKEVSEIDTQLSEEVKQIFTNYLDVGQIKRHHKFFEKNKLFPRILDLSLKHMVHRKTLFEHLDIAIERGVHDYSYRDLFLMYKACICLHHNNQQTYSAIKAKAVQKLLAFGVDENGKSFQQAANLVRLMLWEPKPDKSFVTFVLAHLSNKLLPALKRYDVSQNYSYTIIKQLNDLLVLHRIQVSSERLTKIVQKSQQLHQQRQLNNKYLYSKYEGYTLGFNEDKISELDEFLLMGDQISYGIQSVFETIFRKELMKFGYEFEANPLIGSWEYDVIVQNRRYNLIYPLAGLTDVHDFKALSKQLEQRPSLTWEEEKQFSSRIKSSRKIVDNKFQPVVINLNGRFHYIDSDLYGNKRISRSEEVKYEVLANYGFKKYNIVNGEEWEVITNVPSKLEEYMENLIRDAKPTGIRQEDSYKSQSRQPNQKIA